MRVPHYAMRPLAALALVGLMTGCGGDSNGPDTPFDPAGTTSDLAAVEGSFESEAMYGFQSAAPAMGAVLGESQAAVALRAAPSKMIASGKAGAQKYAGTLARVYTEPTAGMRPVSQRAAILDEHLGVTFTRNPETLAYEPSDRTGAPSNGVRFIVYATNPISGQPVTPLQEVGYADIEVTESATSGSFRIELVAGNVTYLDYTVGATGSQSALAVNIAGFVSNGDDRVNFDLDMHYDLTDEVITFDFLLTVPTRGNFRLDFEQEITNTTLTSSVELSGPHGTVTITGSHTDAGGSYQVRVNGDAFATITVSAGGQPVITGADGEPLTQEELDAMEQIFLVFYGGLDFFEDLLDPLA
jgi:hypothetical protein